MRKSDSFISRQKNQGSKFPMEQKINKRKTVYEQSNIKDAIIEKGGYDDNLDI